MDSHSPGHDSNPGTPKYEVGILTTPLQDLVVNLGIGISHVDPIETKTRWMMTMNSKQMLFYFHDCLYKI
jgi:hypothetical protein